MESGVTWLPGFLWRFSKFWRGLRTEVPWVDRSPAEIVRDHVRLTIQPLDGPPDDARPGARLRAHRLGRDAAVRVGLSALAVRRREAIPEGVPAALLDQILVGNPLATYPRLSGESDRPMSTVLERPRSGPRPVRASRRRSSTATSTRPSRRSPTCGPIWQALVATISRPMGCGHAHGYAQMAPLSARQRRGASRRDAWPPGGGPPGSDLDLHARAATSTPTASRPAILSPLASPARATRTSALGAAMARAVNDWQLDDWTRQDDRASRPRSWCPTRTAPLARGRDRAAAPATRTSCRSWS